MRALVFHKSLQYVDNYAQPEPARAEALIKITHAGICNTDLEITRGYMGFQGIPGHEFVGVVEQCDKKSLIGKRVVGEINISCRKCPECRSGIENHCRQRSVLGILHKDGVFAQYITLPARNLHRIPDAVSDEEAVFVEPLAAAYEILEQVTVNESHNVCVLGDGKMGILTAQVLSHRGCELIVSGHHREKLSILDELDINTIRKKPPSAQFDLVVDCTGSKAGIDTALDIVKPRGTIVVKTTVARRGPIDMNRIVVKEITLTGSRCGPFPAAIEAIASRKIDLGPLVSRTFSLEEGVRAFEHASDKNSLKVLLEV